MKSKSQQSLQPLSLRRNFSWTFVGNMVYAACQWGILVTLTKLGSPEMVGQFTLGLAVTSPVFLFSNLQLRTLMATDAKQEYHFGDYLGLRLVTVFLALLVILGLTFAVGYHENTALIILIFGLAKAIESISDIFYGFLQQHERMDRIAKSMIMKGLLSLMAVGSAIYFTGNVVWAVVALCAAWVLILLGYDIFSHNLIKIHRLHIHSDNNVRKIRFEAQPRWHLKKLTKLILLGLPLGFVMMLISLDGNIPRYFIESYLGQRELGIFAAIAYLQVASNTLVLALGESAVPRLAKYYASSNHLAFRKLVLKLISIVTLLGIGGVLVAVVGGQQILSLIYKPEYAENSNLFVGIMVAAAIGYIASIFGYAATARQQIRYQPVILGAVGIVSLITCFYLIPIYGLWGAIAATNATSVVSTVGYSLLLVFKR